METQDFPEHEPGSYLAVQYAVSRALLARPDPAAGVPEVLHLIGRRLGMEVGALWWVDPDGAAMRCAGYWQARSLPGDAMEEAAWQSCFLPGAGLPGRVWQTAAPEWVPDILHDENFPRLQSARDAGLRAAFAFPARAASGVVGVLEFFQPDLNTPSDDLLAAVAMLGHQVGQYLEHARAGEELRAREAQLRAMLDTSLDAVVSMDHEGRVVEWNRAATELFGYTREKAMGQNMARLIIPPAYRAMHEEGVRRYLATRQARAMDTRLELSGLRRDGTEFPVELTITRVDLDDPPVFTGYLRDISERRRTEQERERLLEAERTAREEAESAGRVKDEFLATLSHELRTPLNAIVGWTHLLQQGGGLRPERLAQGLEVIERNSQAQVRIIEDLLDLSRILSGKVRLDLQTLQLADVAAAALESVTPTAEARGIHLDFSPSQDLPEVRGDPGRLQQVIWNLLSNALKFTPRGGLVSVQLYQQGSRMELEVSDTGQGISAAFLPHVFDRFRQADASTTRRHTGLGLGLSLVRQIVEMHGGDVRAESPGEGQGTTVTISLPVPAASVDPDPDPAAGKAALEVRTPSRTPRGVLDGVRVLIVEDDADARTLLLHLLEQHGAEARAVGSAGEALADLEGRRPDVILSDIGMPDEDGYAFIRRLRARAPEDGGDIPAVALTAFAHPDDRARALAEGFQDHVAKPADSGELITLLAQLARSGAGQDPPLP